MNPVLFCFCWAVMWALDWIPGYCRYYTIHRPIPTPSAWVPRFPDMDKHWAWRWHAQWGFRMLCKMGLIDAFADECDRRSTDKGEL
jgi:hypothetical protein